LLHVYPPYREKNDVNIVRLLNKMNFREKKIKNTVASQSPSELKAANSTFVRITFSSSIRETLFCGTISI